MNPLANAGVSGAVVSLVVAYLGRHGITLSADIVAQLVTLTYTGTHYVGVLGNSLLTRYAPKLEAVVQAALPVAEAAVPAVAAQVATATVYPSIKAAVGAVEAAVAAHG